MHEQHDWIYSAFESLLCITMNEYEALWINILQARCCHTGPHISISSWQTLDFYRVTRRQKKRGFRWRVEHRSTSQRISSNFFRRRWSISEIFEIWNWCTVGNVGTCWNSCTYGNFFRLQGTESVLQQIWRSMSRVVVSSPPTDSLSRSTTFSRSVTTPSLVSRRWLRVGGFLWTGCCYVLLVVDRSNIPPILAFFQHNQPLEFFWAPALAPGKNLHSTEVKWYGWWFNMI